LINSKRKFSQILEKMCDRTSFHAIILPYVLATFREKDEQLSAKEVQERIYALPAHVKYGVGLAHVIEGALVNPTVFARFGRDVPKEDRRYSLGDKDPKKTLKEAVTHADWGELTYSTKQHDHASFYSTVDCEGELQYEGFGSTAELAEDNAARVMLFAEGQRMRYKRIKAEDHSEMRSTIVSWAREAHPALRGRMMQWLDEHDDV
jgi:tRNA threonylcarbamoyladenosine modification (KEOPS) complex  Pcc1 subunit